MEIKTFIVDSFTTEKFKGNPAGVCLLENDISADSMLSIAQELGLSETAYIKKLEGDNSFSIRYFSPKMEIPLCGHATLAAAKVIFKDSDSHQIHFNTVENLDLIIKRQGDEIIMEFPVYDMVPVTVPSIMLEALGIKEIINSSLSEKNKIILLEISDSDVLAGLNPNFNALINSYSGINGVLVTALSKNEKYDYQYRYFWPWAGTNEDPVTGGVQTFLTKYWSEKLHKKTMKAFQSSSRTGYMNVELLNDKVLISSTAIITFEGNLLGIDS
ncbi:PhzF family phenazine biosynthesis protein [Flavobacterium soyangense]|uniref:PhzF family phenazine biosynthesis protein n=1 Tax=Flavobacterium soyangense TaxID=2023265 RepID=A0A930U6N8_9FLAO|nr:PhzF family phenazine biosynthesis protein [Flavobacterium soyangense]MBF2707878.1 PhzF family phenazine biosynthesis protein [Flavobacterium soyangense]